MLRNWCNAINTVVMHGALVLPVGVPSACKFSSMGACLTTNRKVAPHDKEPLTILLLGMQGAGKTTLVRRLTGDPDPVIPTIGFSTANVEFKMNAGSAFLVLYDVGGGERIRGIWPNYYAECHGVVYVVDASDQHRVNEALALLERAFEDPRLQEKPLLVLLSHQDTPRAVNANVPRTLIQIVHCSQQGPRLDNAVRQGMAWLVDQILEHKQSLDQRITHDKTTQAEDYKQQRQMKQARLQKNQ